jgi:hypothetical protein
MARRLVVGKRIAELNVIGAGIEYFNNGLQC